MKKTYNLLIATIVAIAFTACNDDSGSYDPYINQVKKPFYPTTITFKNTNNDGSQIDKKWELTYNDDNTIKTYKYQYSVKASNGVQMTEEHSGELSYHKDASTGNNSIKNTLTINSNVTTLSATESYSDKITEIASISNGVMQKLDIYGERTYSNGGKEPYQNNHTFTYSDKYCTNSTFTDNTGTTSFTYEWGYGKLNNITKYQQDNSNNITQEEYSYTYDNNTLATNYEFNIMAFIYGNMPEIYAAMNLLGVTSAYKIEGENYSGYRSFASTTKPIAPINRNYTIREQSTNTITYEADSPSSITYAFTFSKD